MRVIKRYPNRKLYDTEEKKYITLDGIAELIRNGADIQVIDHTTEEDLTAVTLSQIIFEQEKRSGGFLPKSVLTGLVKSGGETINSLRRSLTNPLGLVNQVNEEIESRLETLVSRGEIDREAAAKLRKKMLSLGSNMADSVPSPGDQLNRLLGSRGVPSREEVEQLSNQIEQLSTKIDSLIDDSDKDNTSDAPSPSS